MKNTILILSALCILLSGWAVPRSTEKNAVPSAPESSSAALPDALFETYYLPEEEPVHAYLQNKSIQRFFNMWLKNYFGDDIEAHWDYSTLAPVQLLDHSFHSIARSDEALYTCTFTSVDGRCGYIIVSYGEGEEGPYITKRSLYETTPYQYDLRANSDRISAALSETDIDLSTASAVRAEWIDTDKNRGDRIILFSDGKNNRYVFYFGDEDYTVQKQ